MLAESSTSWAGVIAAISLVGVVMVATGVAVIAIANRTADGRIGPNALFGVRTRATRASDEAWVAAHQAARPDTVLAGWVSAGTGVVAAVLGFAVGAGDEDRTMIAWSITLGLGIVVLLVFALRGARRGHRAAKAASA